MGTAPQTLGHLRRTTALEVLFQTCLNFVTHAVHDHVLRAADELTILRNEFFEDRTFWSLFLWHHLWIRQG